MQHLLARYSATALGLAPFLYLIVFLFQHRELTLIQLFSGQQAAVLLSTAALGLLFLRYRTPILDVIDRRFFRDRYNARRVLTQLAEQVRGTRNLTELSRLVGSGVDLALHLEGVALLAQDPQRGRFVDPLEEVRPLDPSSRLATLVQGNHEPLVVDFDSPSSPLQALDEQERHWLVDGKVELLAPAFSLDGSMIGLLVLGAKKSELPFLREDRELLKAVCSAAGLVIELLCLKDRPARDETKDIPPTPSGRFPALPAVDPEQQARECPSCNRVHPPTETACPRCPLDLEPALAPYVLR
ncbi:MAG: hypothetical protein MI919_36105, partial [Holophagales bacterium]|nr:hypothetical protein [Holophagales bacterium]